MIDGIRQGLAESVGNLTTFPEMKLGPNALNCGASTTSHPHSIVRIHR
jgi:hypothetical protein